MLVQTTDNRTYVAINRGQIDRHSIKVFQSFFPLDHDQTQNEREHPSISLSYVHSSQRSDYDKHGQFLSRAHGVTLSSVKCYTVCVIIKDVAYVFVKSGVKNALHGSLYDVQLYRVECFGG